MDLFGKKRIKHLEEQADEYASDFIRQAQYITKLEKDLGISKNSIRDMDELIYKMSQCTTWGPMQSYFAELMSGTERRRRAESERIESLIITELNKAS